MEDNLDKHFKSIYADTLNKTLNDILGELEKIGMISKLNILYWNPETDKYKIIKLKPYEE